MNRRSFRTKNTLDLHSLVYITLMCFVLLVFFLALGNVGGIIRLFNLDSGNAKHTAIHEVLQEGTEQVLLDKAGYTARDRQGVFTDYKGGNGDGTIALWGNREIVRSLSSQLMIMDQSYIRLRELTGLEKYDLLVLSSDTYTDQELEDISDYVADGGSVWFAEISEETANNSAAQELMGIKEAGGTETWPGIRFSGEIALGDVLENNKYEVTAVDVSLYDRTKMYACALPENYREMEIDELPPLIWRYAAGEEQGSIYVCNGDFMEQEAMYFMLPTILSEMNGNYVYGVVNSYCVFVEGFPYMDNEIREDWQRYYSRDKLSIAQDLLSPQYLRYYTEYGAHMTYFSRDYERFLTNQNKDLAYYTETIDSSMGLLALKEDERLYLEDSSEKLNIDDWTQGFSFTQNEYFCLPVNYEYTIDDQEEVTFNMLGSAVGLGFYAFDNDVDKLLYNDKGKDIWDEYCKYQEVVFGIGNQHCGWLDRLTAGQALERLYQHLSANTTIEYGVDTIDITTDADSYWMIYKGNSRKISIIGGTAEKIGDRCWLVNVTGHEAQILCA